MDQSLADMPLDHLQVVLDGEAVRFAVLGSNVADEDAHPGGGAEGLANALHEEIGEDARIEAAGADDDHVGFEDRADCVRVRLGRGRVEVELTDAGAGLGDVVLAVDGLVLLGAGVRVTSSSVDEGSRRAR